MHLGSNVAFALAASGALLIYVELVWPGALVPGLAGAAALTFGAYELSRCPIYLPALAPIAVGLLLLLAEIVWHTHFAASVAGTLSLAFGSLHLIGGIQPLSPYLVVPVIVTFGGISSFLATSARRGRRNKQLDLSA